MSNPAVPMPLSNIEDASQWAAVRQLFDELVDQAPELRESRLTALDLDAAILKETRELLAAADQSGDFMTLLPGMELPSAPTYRSLPEGTRIGAFAIDALVGRGGHGEVYRAVRSDGQFEQLVALKLLRPEALSQFDNFRAERQILAGLEHTGIARLIDGGVAPDGRPYMAMEFVEGVPIDIFCATRQLDFAARVRLLRQVAAAVAYAQANLVVHGDIKPGNILVTADGQPKLLDFGIARLIHADELTSGLTLALSTPAYAAPEQLAGRRATIATDIYALGAVLYEILVGRAAWQLGGSPVSWASRILDDEPPLPSMVADASQAQALRGDLDAIVARAMRARPGDRYETVPALMEDLQRYLEHRPVLARNGNALYHVTRFARRNAVAVIAGILVLVTLVVGGTAVGWNMQRAHASRVAAQLEVERGEALRDFMALLFRATYDHREAGLHDAGEILAASAARLEQESQEGAINPQLVRAIGELYFEVEDYAAAKPFLENAVTLARQRGDPALVAQVQRLLASIALRDGDIARTEQLIADADAFFARDTSLYAREQAELDGLRAALLRDTGHPKEAIALLRQAIDQLANELSADSLDLSALETNLAIHLITDGQLDEAGQVIETVQSNIARMGRGDSAVALAALSAGGLIAQLQGDVQRAVDIFGRSVAIRKRVYAPSVALAALDFYYGRGLLQLGKSAEAVPVLDEAAQLAEQFGENGSVYIGILANRALALIGTGDSAGARRDIDLSVTLARDKYGTESPYYGLAMMSCAQWSFAEGNYADARADFAQIRPIFEAMGPGGISYIGVIDDILGRMGNIPPPQS